MTPRTLHGAGALLLLAAAAALAWYGQPDPDTKWRFLARELEPRLTQREVQIEPAELLELMHDDYLDLRLIDVRGERDWNLFHLWGAQRIPVQDIPAYHEVFSQLPENGVIVLMGNDEAEATEAWKRMMATASRPNAYILAGGINRWLDVFAPKRGDRGRATDAVADETLRYPLRWALGSRHPAALPDPHLVETRPFTRRVRLQKRLMRKAGCS